VARKLSEPPKVVGGRERREREERNKEWIV